MQKSNNKKLKILVTGGFGYIGNEIIRELSHKHDIVVNDFDPESVKRFFSIWHNQIDYIHEDVCDLKCPSDIDLIIHLAAEVGYVICDNNPEKTIRTNIEGTKRIASFKKPTLFFSTGSVYGELNSACTEDSHCRPQTLYSKTKFEGEKIIKKELQDYCIVRPATAYGLGFKTRNDLLIHNLAEIAIREKKLIIYQPNAQRTMYHVKNIAAFVNFCVDNWKIFSKETFNLGNKEGNVTKIEIVNEIQKYCKFEIEINETQQDPDLRDYQVDYSKISKVWDNRCDKIGDHIRDIVKYYYNQEKITDMK